MVHGGGEAASWVLESKWRKCLKEGELTSCELLLIGLCTED